jgi:hypothetical protein
MVSLPATYAATDVSWFRAIGYWAVRPRVERPARQLAQKKVVSQQRRLLYQRSFMASLGVQH